MNKHIIEAMRDSNIDCSESSNRFATAIINECSTLLQVYADGLYGYNFNDKARTADACAKMLLEHFGVNHTHHYEESEDVGC